MNTAQFGRPTLCHTTTTTGIDKNDLGTFLILKLRTKFPEAGFYQPGTNVGSPVDQINDRVSHCVLLINHLAQTVEIDDHETIWGEGEPNLKIDLNDPESWGQLIEEITERTAPYRQA